MTNINVEQLIVTVQERFYDIELFGNKPKGYFNHERNYREYHYYERGMQHGYNYIRDISQVLNIDSARLFSIARAARKGEERHNWELHFPANDHTEQIMKYLQA